MATQKEMYELLGRAVVDAEFRARLMEDPAKAAKEEGFELTEEQIKAIKEADLKEMPEALGERLAKMRIGL